MNSFEFWVNWFLGESTKNLGEMTSFEIHFWVKWFLGEMVFG